MASKQTKQTKNSAELNMALPSAPFYEFNAEDMEKGDDGSATKWIELIAEHGVIRYDYRADEYYDLKVMAEDIKLVHDRFQELGQKIAINYSHNKYSDPFAKGWIRDTEMRDVERKGGKMEKALFGKAWFNAETVRHIEAEELSFCSVEFTPTTVAEMEESRKEGRILSTMTGVALTAYPAVMGMTPIELEAMRAFAEENWRVETKSETEDGQPTNEEETMSDKVEITQEELNKLKLAEQELSLLKPEVEALREQVTSLKGIGDQFEQQQTENLLDDALDKGKITPVLKETYLKQVTEADDPVAQRKMLETHLSAMPEGSMVKVGERQSLSGAVDDEKHPEEPGEAADHAKITEEYNSVMLELENAAGGKNGEHSVIAMARIQDKFGAEAVTAWEQSDVGAQKKDRVLM